MRRAAEWQKTDKVSSLMEVCSVCLGQTWFGVPIAPILEIVGGARPRPVPLAPAYVAAWFTTGAMCLPLSRRRAGYPRARIGERLFRIAC